MRKNWTTLGLIIGFLGWTLACSSLSAETCPRCEQINKLRSEALSIKDTDKPADAKKARKVIAQTTKLLDTHKKDSSNQEDLMEYRRLVVLVSDVLPLDPLTSVGEMLYHTMTDKGAQGRIEEYKKGLTLVKDSCKRRFVEAVVKEYQCQDKAQNDEQRLKCVDGFDYEKCAAKK
jgi:hypothetical protein